MLGDEAFEWVQPGLCVRVREGVCEIDARGNLQLGCNDAERLSKVWFRV